jgi:hypothetical protein
LKNSTAALPFQQFPWFDEIEQVEMQLGKNLVRHFQREKPLAFEHIVHVRLRDTGQPGETPLGGFPTTNEDAKVSDEPPPEFAKVHTTPVNPISTGNRVVLGLIVSRLEPGACLV